MRSAWTYSRDGDDACLSQTVLDMFPPGRISKRQLPASHTLLLTIDLTPFNSLEMRPLSQNPIDAFQAHVITGSALSTQAVVISNFAMSVWPWCCKELLRLVADVQHPTQQSGHSSDTTETGSPIDMRTPATLIDGTSIEVKHTGQYLEFLLHGQPSSMAECAEMLSWLIPASYLSTVDMICEVTPMVQLSNSSIGACTVAYTVVPLPPRTPSRRKLQTTMGCPLTILGSSFRIRPRDVCGLEITSCQLQELVGTPYDVVRRDGRTILRGSEQTLQLTGLENGVMTWASESLVPVSTGEPVLSHGARLIDQIEGSRHVLSLFDYGRYWAPIMD